MKNLGFYKTFPFGFAACLLLIVAGTLQNAEAQIFSQDLTMHSTTTSSGMMGRGGGSGTSTEYFSKNAIKTSSSDGNESIMRFDTQKLISIDSKKKTYSEITFQQLQDMLSKAGAAAGGMSDEDMAAMKKVMGQMATPFRLPRWVREKALQDTRRINISLKGRWRWKSLLRAISNYPQPTMM